MDKIKTGESALHAARSALTQFNDTSVALAQRCASDLEGHLPGLDESFRKDIEAYVAEITALRAKISACVAENVSAVDERIAKIPDYSAQTYKKRNII